MLLLCAHDRTTIGILAAVYTKIPEHPPPFSSTVIHGLTMEIFPMIAHPLACLVRKACLFSVLTLSIGSSLGALRGQDQAEWIWHDRWVTSLAKGNEGVLYASLATGMPHREGSVVKLSSENPDEAKELYRQPAAVWAVATNRDGSMLASTDFQGNLAVTPTASGETKHFDKVFGRWTRAIAFASDSKNLAAGNETGTVFVWSLGEGKAVANRDLASGQIMSMGFSPSGEILSVATGSGKLHLLKWPSLETIREVAVGDKPLWTVVFGSKDDQLWVGSADGTVKKVPAQGEPVEIAKLNDWVTSLTTLPGGGLVAVSMRGQIKRSSKADPKTLSDWANGPKGMWNVVALDNDRIVVATQKLGPSILQNVGQLQYVAKDAATKAADRKAAAEKAAAEKAEAEKREADRVAAEKVAAERKAAAEKAAAEKAAADKAAAEKAAAEKAAADKAAADKAAADKAAADKAAADKAAADKAAADKAAADKAKEDKPKTDNE